MKIVRAIKKGLRKSKDACVVKPTYYDIWEQSADINKDLQLHIPAPKMSLPGTCTVFNTFHPLIIIFIDHKESYNPPAEYIPTVEEIEEWERLDPQDKPQNFIPQK
jgi:ribosome biogenesis protein ERB1